VGGGEESAATRELIPRPAVKHPARPALADPAHPGGPRQRVQQRGLTVRGLQGEDLADLAGQIRHFRGCGAGEERRRHVTESEEPLLLRGLRPRRAAWLVRPRRPGVRGAPAGLRWAAPSSPNCADWPWYSRGPKRELQHSPWRGEVVGRTAG